MSRRLLFSTLVVLLLVSPTLVRSQQRNTLDGIDEAAAAELRKKAVDLMQTVAGQVDSLRSAENRARIGSNAAEALWNHDEKRARSLFAAVQEDIKAGIVNDSESEFEARVQTLRVFWQLRVDTLARIGKHDPELAMQFLQETRFPPNVPFPYGEDSEKILELRLASQMAAKKPQLALNLGRRSLEKGFSSDLATILSQLWSRDKEVARTFYREIVEKLKTADLAEDQGARNLAVSLASAFQPPDADESTYRGLTSVLLEGALASGCGQPRSDSFSLICSQIGSLFSTLQKYQGARVAPLKQWVNESDQPDETWRVPLGASDVLEHGTVDEILGLRGRYPQLQRQIYWQAIEKAMALGDLDRARQITSEVPDVEQRDAMIQQLDRLKDWEAKNVERIPSIQEALSSLPNNEKRIEFLLITAGQIGGSNRKASLELLGQASQLIDSIKGGKGQFGAKLWLALQYCSLKSDRGFAIMEPLIPRINELVAASATLDGFDNTYLSDGEWNMSGAGSVGELLTVLAQSAGYFAALDFDRSVSLAVQFERPEIRLMAELKIAQSVLSNQPLENLAPRYPID